MIVVIADDFTGAAELAGMGLTHGLKVVMKINDLESSDADMLVIVTDTRSKDLNTAVKELHELSVRLSEIRPTLVYKKIDSVLRGHILEETNTMVDALGVCGAIVVPANPLLNRIIVDGKYYIDGHLLEETSFSDDPEFRITTSSVIDILKKNGNGNEIHLSLNKPDEFNGEGKIIVGEAATAGDLDFWAEKSHPGWLPCGAAGFFEAVLKSVGISPVDKNHSEGFPPEARSLFLCGSTFQTSRNMVSSAAESGPCVSYMPGEVLRKEPDFQRVFEQWIEQVIQIVEKHGRAIIAVREPVIADPNMSAWIRNCSASLVSEVHDRTLLEELFIEGGSTASAVIGNMGLTRFKPLNQFQQGVIRMKAEEIEGLNLTLKPGSYIWPDSIWNF